jgi:hypothetical protein
MSARLFSSSLRAWLFERDASSPPVGPTDLRSLYYANPRPDSLGSSGCRGGLGMTISLPRFLRRGSPIIGERIAHGGGVDCWLMGGGGERGEDLSLGPGDSDDPVLAAAGGTAELSALVTLGRLCVAEPTWPRVPQLLAVAPEVRPGTGVPAELAELALARTGGAALPEVVRHRQLVLPVAAVTKKQTQVWTFLDCLPGYWRCIIFIDLRDYCYGFGCSS